ncbi:MAG: sugar-binding protein [Planctomycetales bacterium]
MIRHRPVKPFGSCCLALLGIVVIEQSLCQSLSADSAEDWGRMREIVPKGYVCSFAEEAPRIDGKLDDAAWRVAPWTEDFVDIEGDRQARPRFRTRAKMTWDADFFYVAAEMEEPHVWGTLTKHDAVIFHDNDFELFIDPDGDNHEYYEFEINALNTGWDLFLPRPYKDGGRAENRWEIPGLKTAIGVAGTLNDPSDTDTGWCVEIAIPWDVLREYAHRPSPPREGDQWRVNFSRVEWQHQIEEGEYRKTPQTREDNWVWSPQGIIDMHRPERWGVVQFTKTAPGATRFQPDPALRGREALLEVYHLQKAFHQKQGRWAHNLEELAPDRAGPRDRTLLPRLTTDGDTFRAVVEVPLGDQTNQAWSIRHDSRLRRVTPDDALCDTLEGILSLQAAAWNRGDLAGFMEHYWKSDELTFSSGGHSTRGWKPTKANYLRRYPTRAQMGQLSFGALEVTSLGESAAMVLGRWNLERDAAPIGGNFSLVFRRLEGNWVIVHDHTSQD